MMKPRGPEPIIELSDVTVRYQGSAEAQIVALDHLSLSVDAGEFVAVMGTSGSGKSTLVNVLGLLMQATSGTYRLLGRDVTALGDDERSALRSSTIGFIFQDYALVDHLTVLQNVMLPLAVAPLAWAEVSRAARQKLTSLGLGDKLERYPRQLSGGQKQRVAIARALMRSPQLIIADEPAGALDAVSRNDVLGILQELHRGGVTVILVTHSNEDASAANRLIRIEHGKVSLDEPQRRTFDFAAHHGQAGASPTFVDDLVVALGPRSPGEFLRVAQRCASRSSQLYELLSHVDEAWVADEHVFDLLCQQAIDGSTRNMALAASILLRAHDRAPDQLRLAEALAALRRDWGPAQAAIIIDAALRSASSLVARFVPTEGFLSHRSPHVRALATRLLTLEAERRRLSREQIARVLDDPDGRVRANAIEALVREPEWVEVVERHRPAADPSPRVRAAWAVALLGRGQVEDARAILEGMLRQRDVAELRAASYVLAAQDRIDVVEFVAGLESSGVELQHDAGLLLEALRTARWRRQRSTREEVV